MKTLQRIPFSFSVACSLWDIPRHSPEGHRNNLSELRLVQPDSVPCHKQLDQKSYRIQNEPVRFPSSRIWNWDEEKQVWVGLLNRGSLNWRVLFSRWRSGTEGQSAWSGRNKGDRWWGDSTVSPVASKSQFQFFLRISASVRHSCIFIVRGFLLLAANKKRLNWERDK